MENQNNNNSQPTVDVAAPKSKLPVIAGSAVGVVAVAGIATACVLHFVPSARDWLDRKTSEPDEYFAEKEEKYIEDNLSTVSESLGQVSEAYSSFNLSELDINDLKLPAGAYNISTDVSFDVNSMVTLMGTLDKEAIDTSSSEVAATLELMSTFKSFSIDGTVISDGKGLVSVAGKLELNDSSVVDANIIIDTQEKSIYVGIPTLSSSYLKYTLSEAEINAISESLTSATSNTEEMQEYLEYVDMSAEVLNLLSENLTDIVTDYYKIIIDGVKDGMELDEDASIEIAGADFSVSEMSTEVTQEDVIGIAKDVLKQAKDDDNLKSIAKTLGAENEYTAAIEEMLEEIDNTESSDSDETATFYAWTDKKGNLVGHKLKVDDSEFGYAVINDGDDTYASVWISDNNSKMDYSAVLKGENKESGTIKFTMDVDGTYMVEKIEFKDYKLVDAQKGLFNIDADITFEIDSKDVPESVKQMAEKLSVKFTSDCDDDSQKVSLGLNSNGDSLLSVAFETEKLSDTTVALPSAVIEITKENTETALRSYFETITLSTIKENIKKSLDNSVLSTYVDTLFTQLGLDKIDGTQSSDDVLALIQQISSATGASSSSIDYSDYDYSDYDYSDYDYSDYDYTDYTSSYTTETDADKLQQSIEDGSFLSEYEGGSF